MTTQTRIDAVADAWARFPQSEKPDLMLRHPELYWAVARLSAEVLVARERQASTAVRGIT